ncbi:MAG: class B sortase [Oscillospiraceae bacterium]|nr:class B sortase [Oscillospiraceae bacterium]
MKRSRALLFLIPALLLAGLLVYSLTRAAMILIPQQREQDAFAELKRSALAEAAPDAALPPSPSAAPPDGPDAGLETDADPGPDGSPDPAPTPDPAYRFALLAERNGDFVGWLSAADTVLDDPVMRSAEADPEYYLHRDFYGAYSDSGCLFIGAGCDADSDAFIIYGHNMNNGTMFGSLDRCEDEAFARAHAEINLSMPEGERVYRVFAAFQTRVYAEREQVFKYYEAVGAPDGETYAETVARVRAMSIPQLPWAPAYPAQLLYLSTCSYHTAEGRFVVAAYRVA